LHNNCIIVVFDQLFLSSCHYRYCSNDTTKIADKIKEKVGTIDNLSKFKKFSKLKASYVEYDKFSDSNLHEGYFCYNCIYWINVGDGKCMLVENDGPDVLGKVSDVIAPHGCYAGYEANYDKLHDTRNPSEAQGIDTEKNKEKVTSADVT
jgi:hypothetical protein